MLKTQPDSARMKKARHLTQTCEGKYTHHRKPERREYDCNQYDAKLFKDKRVNRDAYHPKGV